MSSSSPILCEVLLYTGSNLEKVKSVTDDEIVDLASHTLPYFEKDLEVEGALHEYFRSGSLSKTNRLRLEALWVHLTSIYAINDSGAIVSVSIK